ncbi:uncharacterized protein LOC116568556 [Mustela erminea]|uniref:uncharacterized protein LOC116568556 n=1 Tax=Mustela erminea TaxID=36723 RepID=UPI0013869546|nr:uncharacterized protein LOC116568556 [Mustela erminea]
MGFFTRLFPRTPASKVFKSQSRPHTTSLLTTQDAFLTDIHNINNHTKACDMNTLIPKYPACAHFSQLSLQKPFMASLGESGSKVGRCPRLVPPLPGEASAVCQAVRLAFASSSPLAASLLCTKTFRASQSLGRSRFPSQELKTLTSPPSPTCFAGLHVGPSKSLQAFAHAGPAPWNASPRSVQPPCTRAPSFPCPTLPLPARPVGVPSAASQTRMLLCPFPAAAQFLDGQSILPQTGSSPRTGTASFLLCGNILELVLPGAKHRAAVSISRKHGQVNAYLPAQPFRLTSTPGVEAEPASGGERKEEREGRRKRGAARRATL